MGSEILVVDDEPSVLEIFRRVLSRDGHRVRTCTSAVEALSEMGRVDFDLLVVDKNLPGISGLDLLTALRKVDQDLPAILMTAAPDPLLARTSGLQGYLPKPFKSLKQISDTVRRVLELADVWQGCRDHPEESELTRMPVAAYSSGLR